MGTTALPTPTRDVERATQDMDEFGYTLIADALGPEQVSAMRDRLIEQALCEAKARGASISLDDETATGFVQSLLNKGSVWRDVIDPHDEVHQVLEHAFTPAFDPIMSQTAGLDQKYIVSSLGAKFKRRDQRRQEGELTAMRTDVLVPDFHIDQKWAAGHLDYPLVVTVFYLLTDFTADNGCTLVVPGSHKIPTPEYGVIRDDKPQVGGRPAWDRHLFSDIAPEVTKDAIPVEAPAGTAFIFEGRTWHAGGINTSGELRAHVNGFHCAPYIRQRELYSMNLRQDVVDELSDAQLTMLGFDTVLQGGGDGLFNLIEPTLGRTNVTNKRECVGELHDPTLISV